MLTYTHIWTYVAGCRPWSFHRPVSIKIFNATLVYSQFSTVNFVKNGPSPWDICCLCLRYCVYDVSRYHAYVQRAYACAYMYIYIYIEREREGEIDRYVHIYI